MYWVDIPNSNKRPSDHDFEGQFVNVAQFRTREEAIAFVKENYGADDDGNINLLTEGADDL